MGEPANFVVTKYDKDEMTIVDVGPWDTHLTVTNDAEDVVKKLYKFYNLDEKKLLYQDRQGEVSELLHDHAKFTGFGYA